MGALGADFAGGWFRRLYDPVSPAGVWRAVLLAAALLLLHQGLQVVFATTVLFAVFRGALDNPRDLIKASLVVLFPVSLVVAALAWRFAGARGADAKAVLSLRTPQMTPAGWVVLLGGFMLAMYLAMLLIVTVFGIDLGQYTPGPDGASPKSGSAGLVKEAVFDIANEPWLFALVLPSIALGAPIAEEVVFRGQLFSALSRTWLGVSGTTLVTAGLWAGLHVTEPWLSVGLIFIMGLVFGWMMYRFGSLWVTIACHAVWNSTYALIVFASAGGQA